MRTLHKPTFKDFYDLNEFVAKTSPMRTHYNSFNPLERFIWSGKKQTVQKLLDKIKIKNIIDLGCGDGSMLSCIKSDTDYTGVDISPAQIDSAKKLKRKNAKFLIDDVTNLKIKNNSFDGALLCDVVEHVLSPMKLFNETKRIVKPNGFMIMAIPNESLWQIARLLTLRFPLRSPDHLTEVTPEDIKTYFPEIIERVNIPFNFFPKLSLIHIFLIKNVK
jgi:ubiquinone/menaquinone biosynthesis C-methylase UbiE